MTTRHTDRCSQLGKNIKRCHNCDRSCKSFQITAKSAGLYLLCCDHNENHNCPGSLSRKVCCRASKSDQTDQVGNHAGCKKCCNEWYQVSEFLTHISDYKAVGLLYNELCHSLTFGNVLFFQIMCQPDTQTCYEYHNNPAYHHCLTDP